MSNRYIKSREAISKADPIFRKNVSIFEKLIIKGHNRTPEEEDLLKRFNPHVIKHANTRKGKALFKQHQRGNFRIWQAHIPSSGSNTQHIVAMAIDAKSKVVRFLLVGTHADTSG